MRLAAEVFDYEVAVRRLGGDERLRDHAWEFLQLHREHLCQIRRAICSRNAVALARSARTLQNALRGLSGTRCRTQAVALERLARSGSFGEAFATCMLLEQDMADLVLALDSVVTPKTAN
jgi:hypothetical protein